MAAAKKKMTPAEKMAIETSTGLFLVKSEPSVYPFSQLVAEKKTGWTGIRNFEARNNLRAMKKGDTLLYYHSNEGKEIVGVARVTKEAYADPTATEGDWTAVEIAPVKRLKKPVGLDVIKAHPVLSKMALVKKGRISVVQVTQEELATILELAGTKLE